MVHPRSYLHVVSAGRVTPPHFGSLRFRAEVDLTAARKLSLSPRQLPREWVQGFVSEGVLSAPHFRHFGEFSGLGTLILRRRFGGSGQPPSTYMERARSQADSHVKRSYFDTVQSGRPDAIQEQLVTRGTRQA